MGVAHSKNKMHPPTTWIFIDDDIWWWPLRNEVHNFMSSSWALMNFSWTGHEKLIKGVHELKFLKSSWFFSWAVDELLMHYTQFIKHSWIVHELFMECSWTWKLHKIFIKHSWHGVLWYVNFLWAFLELVKFIKSSRSDQLANCCIMNFSWTFDELTVFIKCSWIIHELFMNLRVMNCS